MPHPLWAICLLVRAILIFVTRYTAPFARIITATYIGAIAVGFLYKAVTGSNNEVQVEKVFWHDSRLLHACMFALSSIYILRGDPAMAAFVLIVDVLASVAYRIWFRR